MANKKDVYDELSFCLKLWQEQGSCQFGGCTRCDECAAPYVLWKLLTGEVLHDADAKRLSCADWQALLHKIKK